MVFPHKFTLDIQTPPQEVFGCLGLWATNLGLNSTDSEGIFAPCLRIQMV